MRSTQLQTGMTVYVEHFPLSAGDILSGRPEGKYSLRLRVTGTNHNERIVNIRPWRWFDYLVPAWLYRATT